MAVLTRRSNASPMILSYAKFELVFLRACPLGEVCSSAVDQHSPMHLWSLLLREGSARYRLKHVCRVREVFLKELSGQALDLKALHIQLSKKACFKTALAIILIWVP